MPIWIRMALEELASQLLWEVIMGEEANGGWIGTALSLLGDVIDPFLPGFAGSELRPTSSTVTLATINTSRKAAGMPPLRMRHRRHRALTKNDKADIAFIAGMLGKPAGRDFAMIVAGMR